MRLRVARGRKGGTVVVKEDIKKGLKRLGLKEGDIVLVHSSLSSFGYLEGGADTVIDALLETVGKEGTILVPTLTTSNVNSGNPVFDVKRTPSVTGRIPEVFRKRPEARRSFHPTHSVAAIGAKAEYMTRDHEKSMTPCSRNSPYGKLVALGGYILFLGVDLNCNTTLHAMEELADVPYLFAERIEQLSTIDESGNEIPVPSRRHRAIIYHFRKMEPLLLRKRIMRTGKIGDAVIRLVAAKPMAELTMDVLTKNPTFFSRPHRARALLTQFLVRTHVYNLLRHNLFLLKYYLYMGMAT